MISPLQMRSFHILELNYRANPESDLSSSIASTRIRVGEKQVELKRSPSEQLGELPNEWHLAVDIDVDFVPPLSSIADGAVPSFTVLLAVELNRDEADFSQAPYQVGVLVVGEFEAAPIPGESRERSAVVNRIKANAVSLLYSQVRSVVLDVTSKSPYNSLLMPALNFNGVLIEEDAVDLRDEVSPVEGPEVSNARRKTSKVKEKN